MRIAINQPYFIPYSGYFRLLAATDLFVVLDSVQHIRRGYLHRNKLLNRAGNPEWLTLPIKPCARDTLIKDLEFSDNKDELWKKQLKKFPIFDGGEFPLYGTPSKFITKSLQGICEQLKLPCHIAYSSELDIPPGLKGQDRIIAICNHFHATEYINAPGGKKLYNPDAFRLYGMKLKFLPEWKGSYLSVLQHIEEPGLREEIVSQC